MQDWPDYQLIDFGAGGRGGGRKLERFGTVVCDRPCPAAHTPVGDRSRWGQAATRYTGAKVGDGRWVSPQPTTIASSGREAVEVPLADGLAFQMRVELSPAGQVGLFPEQFANWRWIARRVAAARRPWRLLNLFAYTGGSTLAAAAAGAAAAGGEAAAGVEVTHVDASKPSVALARQNAELSGLAAAPIRWFVEDALKFCRREARRGNRYDAVVLDPPTYGHGPKGEEWRLARDLPVLLELIAELTDRAPALLLASCHTPGVGPAELSAYVADAVVGHCAAPPASGRLWLATEDGRRLESGVYARMPS
ncbi:MAG: class I SAM-dependent methyltransferase [Planctomycetota bacterium]